jgi:hypothetical protein
MSKRSQRLILLLCAALGVACGSDRFFEPDPVPAYITLEIQPSGVSVPQGGVGTLAAFLQRSSAFVGSVNLTVTGVPPGVAAVISNVETNGLVTTATVTLNVSGSAIPGAYNVVVHGTATGVAGSTAAFDLTVEPVALCPASGVCEQWAMRATASSEWSETDWSANQATGQPNVAGCADDARAWASLESNGVDWLELEYNESVRPTEIRVHETFAPSAIVKVEVKDGAGTYHTVYTASPGSQSCPRVLTIPVTGISAMVKVVRVSLDQRTMDYWNEIDAVKLIGVP